MKRFCESLRKHAMKIINFKMKKMKLLTKEHQESYENAKICYTCKGKFENKTLRREILAWIYFCEFFFFKHFALI